MEVGRVSRSLEPRVPHFTAEVHLNRTTRARNCTSAVKRGRPSTQPVVEPLTDCPISGNCRRFAVQAIAGGANVSYASPTRRARLTKRGASRADGRSQPTTASMRRHCATTAVTATAPAQPRCSVGPASQQTNKGPQSRGRRCGSPRCCGAAPPAGRRSTIHCPATGRRGLGGVPREEESGRPGSCLAGPPGSPRRPVPAQPACS